MDRSDIAYWDRLSTYWSVPPPLSPAESDLAWFGARIAERECRRVLLLGATAALASLRWPRHAALAALDWSTGMLTRALGPGNAARVAGDWRRMPLAAATQDVLIGDGCYSALGSAEDAVLFTTEMRRVLHAHGEVWMRCFVQPQGPASVAEVLEALDGSAVPAHLFRWRLAMAVHGAARYGFALHEAWEAWSRVPDRLRVARRLDWTEAEVQRFERWRGESARYAFPTLERLRDIVSGSFEVVRVDASPGPLGECFPRLQLRRR
ncbi:MAG TPA: hypothetical protein VEB41_05345 [Burkholderiales bacterium]|nr:hypothetical protein [Burkholderiales bacterium]